MATNPRAARPTGTTPFKASISLSLPPSIRVANRPLLEALPWLASLEEGLEELLDPEEKGLVSLRPRRKLGEERDPGHRLVRAFFSHPPPPSLTPLAMSRGPARPAGQLTGFPPGTIQMPLSVAATQPGFVARITEQEQEVSSLLSLLPLASLSSSSSSSPPCPSPLPPRPRTTCCSS